MTDQQAVEQPVSSLADEAPVQPSPIADPYAIQAPAQPTPDQAYLAPTAYQKPKRPLIVRLRPLLGIAIVGALALGGKIVHDHNTAGRDANGAIAKKGDLDAFSIKTGDCFTDPGVGADFSSVTAIPCGQPHTAQVYGSFAFPDATSVVPDDTTLRTAVGTQCEQLQTQLDANFVNANSLDSSFIRPNDTAWSHGNYTILCLVTSSTPFTGDALAAGA